MTTTAKVFVVLVCLFAFIFTPMAIQFAARTHNWRQTALDYRDLAESAYANERSVLAIAAAEIERYKKLRDEQRELLLDTQQSFDELQREMAALQEDYETLKSTRDSLQRSVALLTSQMEIESKQNAELAQAKEAALERERTLRMKEIALTKRINELTADLVVRSQQLKQKLAELSVYRDENEELRRALKIGSPGEVSVAGPTPLARAAAPVATSPIMGQITRVDGRRATINVGSASGVRPGMVMVVMRGDDYIADLEITEDITPNEAVGMIMHERDRRVRAFDQVIDEASLERRG